MLTYVDLKSYKSALTHPDKSVGVCADHVAFKIKIPDSDNIALSLR